MNASKNAGPFPKDILRVILMLVDRYADLHRCQLTCKSWRALIVDNALFDRLFSEEKVYDFNDWEDGVRPGDVTAEMLRDYSVFAPQAAARWGSGMMAEMCVIGEAGTGKTALTIQYCSNHFVEEYDPTIEDSYRKQIKLLGTPVVADILDTAGCEEFSMMRHQWLIECEVIILCVNMARPASDVLSYARQIMEHERVRAHPDLKISPRFGDELVGRPALLVATKCDLPGQISGQELLAFAKAYRMGLVVTSAKENTRVARAFEECVMYAAARRLSELSKKEKKKNKAGKGCVFM
jgi:GTPase KRas protein